MVLPSVTLRNTPASLAGDKVLATLMPGEGRLTLTLPARASACFISDSLTVTGSPVEGLNRLRMAPVSFFNIRAVLDDF